MSALVVPSGECLRGEGLVWLFGAVVKVKGHQNLVCFRVHHKYLTK